MASRKKTARSAAPQSHFTAEETTKEIVSNSDDTDGYGWPNTGRVLPWTQRIVHEVKR